MDLFRVYPTVALHGVRHLWWETFSRPTREGADSIAKINEMIQPLEVATSTRNVEAGHGIRKVKRAQGPPEALAHAHMLVSSIC